MKDERLKMRLALRELDDPVRVLRRQYIHPAYLSMSRADRNQLLADIAWLERLDALAVAIDRLREVIGDQR